ncbi:MAG TPA: hypothetical protein VE547_09835 [Mycobacteriales bacterium]|nr:hypothetical protein [Mycobacteriales bacterium]
MTLRRAVGARADEMSPDGEPASTPDVATAGCRWTADGSACRASRGPADSRRRTHVLHAARDLADELARSGGQVTPRVEHARAEVARLRA